MKEVSIALAVSEALAANPPPAYTGRWAGSPFKWVLTRPPAVKGKVGVAVLQNLLEQMGYTVSRGSGVKNTIGVNGVVLKVKVSFEWASEGGRPGGFAFEQIKDQKYDLLVMLAVSPRSVSLWCVPKDVAMENSIYQHAKESRWVRFDTGAPPTWLSPYGGELSIGLGSITGWVGDPAEGEL